MRSGRPRGLSTRSFRTPCVRLAARGRGARRARETNTDMMRRMSMPAGTRRWPLIVIAVLVLLFIRFTVMSGFYVDLLWFREVKLSSVFWTVLRTKLMLGSDLRAAVLRAAVREPADRPLAHADDQDPHARTGGRRPGPSEPRALPAVAHPARLRRRSRSSSGSASPASGRRSCCGGTAPGSRSAPGAALPPRSRLLHLHAAVAPLPAGVAVLLARRRDADRGHRALRLGRDPAAGAGVRRQGGSRRARPPVGAARPDHAGEGVGLLPGPVRPAHVAARRRRGGVVHRRACAAAGAQLPGDRRGDLRGAVPGEHPRAPVEPAGDRGRPARAGLGPARHGVPRVRAAVQRQAAGAAARDPVHRGQHRRDTRRAFALDKIDISERPADPDVSADALDENAPTVSNIRLWRPSVLEENFQSLQRIRQYYEFEDVDVDRYDCPGARAS